jgi:nitrile hydratase accessory protein
LYPPDFASETPVFAEPWEARAFAIVVMLHERGVFSWKEWSDTLAEEIREGGQAYYEHWLRALEKLVERKQLIAQPNSTRPGNVSSSQ